jgi:hypothetical protein
VDRLRTILVLRGALALFLAGLGVVLLARDSVVFGVFALVAAVVNGALIAVLARRARHPG